MHLEGLDYKKRRQFSCRLVIIRSKRGANRGSKRQSRRPKPPPRATHTLSENEGCVRRSKKMGVGIWFSKKATKTKRVIAPRPSVQRIVRKRATAFSIRDLGYEGSEIPSPPPRGKGSLSY